MLDLQRHAEAQKRRITKLTTELERATTKNAEALETITTAQRRSDKQQREIADLSKKIQNLEMEIDLIQRRMAQQTEAILNSRSWRITAPLRKIGKMLRGVRTSARAFIAASKSKGGLLAGTWVVVRILVREGPSGLRARLETVSPGPLPRPLSDNLDVCSCFIAATPHVTNLAQMMARVLREEGYNTTIDGDIRAGNQYNYVFVICPQMFDRIPDEYFAVQMEQSVSSRWFTPDYFDTLKRARAIIDYSLKNINFLQQNGLPLQKLYHVPLDTDRASVPQPEAPRNGILFYGDWRCPRRQHILLAVAGVFPQLRIFNSLFGESLERELRQAAVVLNIHYYDNALLETTRIHQALSYGTPVVSEISSDADEHTKLNGIVDFAPIGDISRIIELLRPYVENRAENVKKRIRIAEFSVRHVNEFEIFFRRFLLSQKMISYQRFCEQAPDYQLPISTPAKLCLSLPETPDRRSLFLSQRQSDFRTWDGLKASPGWLGAGLSYRYLFEKLLESGINRAIICEDDVLFPSDFCSKMNAIERYLDRQEWDVFTGLIADAHPDLKILEVEEFEGLTFVRVDRTVSMVFNIYNREIMEYLSSWDFDNQDVHANTIDRYLERRRGTQVILTLPFLVGHRPDVKSTIWGFDNTQYDDLVAKSEAKLVKKVAEFRLHQKE